MHTSLLKCLKTGFGIKNGITFDLEVVEGRSNVRWKAETSYFSIVEMSKFLGTMRQTCKGKKSFVGFPKNGFLQYKIV